jgi:hypothetical protein
MNHHDDASELRNNHLKASDHHYDTREYEILEYAGKNIEFVVDLPNREHVENLHNHESVEHPSQMSRCNIVFIL